MNKRIFLLTLLLGLLVACHSELQPIQNYDNNLGAVESKILNTRSLDSHSSSLFVKILESGDDGFEDSVPECATVSKVFTATPGKEELEKRFGLDRWYEIALPTDADIEDVAARLARDKGIQFVQFDQVYTKASDGIAYPVRKTAAGVGGGVFNDPLLQAQWHYINKGNTAISKSISSSADINVSDVWTSLTCGDNSIIVAVIDEGVKYTHPDLKDNIWTGTDGSHGKNFVTGGEITWNKEGDSGHGTHCAGTISAINNNGLGVSGIAGGSGKGDGVKIMSCQIFDGGTSASSRATANAFKYAADNGASVASCSFGYKGGYYKSDDEYLNGNSGSNRMESDAIHYFEASKNNTVLDGGIVIFASGNDALDYAEYPGALHDIISVSAFGPDFLPAYYTNYGPGCNIVAPGGEYYHYNAAGKILEDSMVLSTLPSELVGGDYGYMQGTSMACPHVAGIAALGLSYAKKLGRKFTVQEFKDMLLTSANDFDRRLQGTKELYGKSISLYKYAKMMGSGSVDTWKFMMKIEGIPSVVVQTGKEQWINVSSWFGTSSVNLTYIGEVDGDKVFIDIPDSDIQSLGLASRPYMRYGKLFVHPSRPGACKLTIRAIAGGTIVGGGDSIGGMEVSQTISLIARSFTSDNGGWL